VVEDGVEAKEFCRGDVELLPNKFKPFVSGGLFNIVVA
jgi:hypothetical protein